MSNLRTIKIRGDSTENWELANPILEYKEMACEFADNGTFFKIGNGIDSWNDLAYVSTLTDTEITDAEVKQKYENNPDTNAFTDDDKSKLSGIATGATKNDTDANLKNRANHTGTQAISTVSGLQSALDGKEASFIKNTAFNKNFGTTAGTVTQGNDTRLSDAREWTASVVPQAEAEGGTSTTARKWTSQRVRQAIVAWWNTIGTTFGKTLLGSANAEDARTTLGLGTVIDDLDSKVDKVQAKQIVTANKTLTAADSGKLLIINSDGITITMPANANFNIDIAKMDEDFITIVQCAGADKFREDTATISVIRDVSITNSNIVGKEWLAIGAYEV